MLTRTLIARKLGEPPADRSRRRQEVGGALRHPEHDLADVLVGLEPGGGVAHRPSEPRVPLGRAQAQGVQPAEFCPVQRQRRGMNPDQHVTGGDIGSLNIVDIPGAALRVGNP